jgi:glycosyltransferase involved in cell wall biosynthesis
LENRKDGMNILFICNEYPPSPHGGIGTVTQTIARGLFQKGNAIVIAGCYNTISTPLRVDNDNGILIFRLGECKGFLRYVRNRFKLYLLVKKIIKKHAIDICEAPDYQGLLAFWPRLPVPIVIRLHGSDTYFQIEMGQPVSSKAFHLEYHNLRKAASIISVSKYTAEKTREIFHINSPMQVIYNSIQIKTVDPGSKPSRDPNKVVFTGTLMKKKGIFSLLEAWPGVVYKFPEGKLHLFGKDSLDGSGASVASVLFEKLSPSTRHSVIFHGRVDREKILFELSRAAVAVFPSFSEAFALAPLEAMAQECPTIFTKLSSGAEIIDDGINGLLINPRKPEQISEAIVKILMNSNLAERIGSEGRKKVMKNFSNEKIITQNEVFYRDLLKKRKQ